MLLLVSFVIIYLMVWRVIFSCWLNGVNVCYAYKKLIKQSVKVVDLLWGLVLVMARLLISCCLMSCTNKQHIQQNPCCKRTKKTNMLGTGRAHQFAVFYRILSNIHAYKYIFEYKMGVDPGRTGNQTLMAWRSSVAGASGSSGTIAPSIL